MGGAVSTSEGRRALQIILKNIEQVIGEAVGAMAFAVLLDFGDHPPQQSGPRFTGRHGLGAGGAFGPARAEVQDGLSPMGISVLSLATTKADQPGPLVFQVELAERSFDFIKHSYSRRGEYARPSVLFSSIVSKVPSMAPRGKGSRLI